MWRLRWTSRRIVAAFLFVGETTKAREKLRKLRQTKMEANYEAEQNVTKKALLLTNEVTKFDSRSDISSGSRSVRSDGSVQGESLREQIHWSTAPTVLGQTEPAEPQNRTPTRPLHLIWFCFWGQIECAPGCIRSTWHSPRAQVDSASYY